MDEYAAFAAIYDDWASHMTEDVPFYLELVREADGPVVELAVGNGRVAVPIAQETGKKIIGIDRSPAMLALAKEKAAEAGVELELHEGDMRDFALDEPAALVYCPFRAMLHLPTWSDKRRVFERVAAALAPGGRFVWNSFVFNPRIAAANDGVSGGAARHPPPGRPLPRRQPHRHHARVRRQRLALVGDEERVGRADRRRPGSRSRRSTATSSARRSTSRAASSSGSRGSRGEGEPVRQIAELYDPWSRSVVEDVGFYVAEARKSGGTVVELGIGTGPDRDPDRRDRQARDRGRLLARDARRVPAPRRGRRRRRAPRSAPRRPARTRRSTSRCRSSSARSARTCTWPTTATARRRSAAARDTLVPGGRLIFDVFAPGDDDIADTHGRWLEREPDIYERADWDTDSRTLTLSVKGPEGAATMALSWISRGEWIDLLEEAGFAVEACYGWFDRTPYRGGEDMIFVARRA